MNPKKLFTVITILLLLTNINQASYSQQDSDQKIITELDFSINKLIAIQKEIVHIHPFLKTFHPIAIVEEDHLFIFDYDSLDGKYQFQKKVPVPFPMPAGIMAAFPLSGYDNKPTCVVGRNIFDSFEGYVFIFHEFIHCSQALTCEYALKEKLNIARIAMQNQNYSWELNHPFPYEDSVFVKNYSGFLAALENNDQQKTKEFRSKLKNSLKEIDFEYLVWQEWKEGFARLIENKIRSKFSLKINNGGKEKPYNRVAFYYGGSNYINYITQKQNELFVNIEALFSFMFE